MRQALVTGATGGLGIALVTALVEAGYGVRATGRRAAAARRWPPEVDFRPAELTDPAAADMLVEGMDVIFHAAALSSPWGDPAAFQAVNVEATRLLVEAAAGAGCDSFVFVSTPSIYAEPRDRLGLTESSPLAARFANAYAATKHQAEQLVLAADRPGFRTVAIRPRALVGPDDRVLLPRLVRVARSGRFPLFRHGRAMIELTDVRDAAEAAIAADRRHNQVGGRAFNVSGGAPATVRETLAEIFAALGLAPRLFDLPYRPTAMACAAMEAVCARLPGRPEPPATAYSLSTLAFSQTFDLTGARQGLDWRPRHTPHDAIVRAAQGWSDHAPV